MKVLITSGGCIEPIDGVRSITNFSSGKTGATISDFFASKGESVTLLHGTNSALPTSPVNRISFSDFASLKTKILKLLETNRFDAVIHLAAVSDYSIDHIIIDGQKVAPGEFGKIKSDQTLNIVLKKNEKIIDLIKNTTLVGFKLTNTTSTEEQVQAINKISHKVDYLVHNDLHNIDQNKHIANIYKNEILVEISNSKTELAKKLYKLLANNRSIK